MNREQKTHTRRGRQKQEKRRTSEAKSRKKVEVWADQGQCRAPESLRDSSHPWEELSDQIGQRAGKEKSLCTLVAWGIQEPSCQVNLFQETHIDLLHCNSLLQDTIKKKTTTKSWTRDVALENRVNSLLISCVLLFSYCISLLSFHSIAYVLAIWSIHCLNNIDTHTSIWLCNTFI